MTPGDDLSSADNWRAHWPAAAGEPPVWLPTLALGELLDTELVAVAAAAADAPVTPGAARSLLALITGTGLVETVDVDGTTGHRFGVAVSHAMLGEVDARPGGLAAARAALLRAGLAADTGRLSAQLALWAAQARDWATLESLWLHSDPTPVLASPAARQAFLEVPREQRQRHPGLSFAYGVIRSHDAGRADYDIDTLVKECLHEGRELHAKWAGHDTVDGAVLAGSLWMVAQASVAGSVDRSGLGESWDTHLALEQLVNDRTRQGDPPSRRSLVAFHALSTGTAILRSDWKRMRLHAELGMTLADRTDIFGRVAQAAFATISLMNGSPGDFQRAVSAGTGAHFSADSMRDLLVMAQLLGGIAALDRETTLALLAGRHQMSSWLRWFNFQPMFIWVRAQAAILWADPERALAEFDADLAGYGQPLGTDSQWGPLLQRTRAELLLNVGSLNRAETIVARLLASPDRVQALVPAARLQLCSGRADLAGALADEGIHSLQVPLPDRAQLAAIKAGAALLGGAEPAAVQRQAAAACAVCGEAGSALPLALLPQSLREQVLALHGPHADGSPCILAEAAAQGRFDGLRQAFTCRVALVRLTPRERELLPLLATPATVSQIAEHLYVSVNTVRKQLATLRQKLGARNRADLIRRAHELGLFAGPES